jgi:rhodanese-related sulfurtransferase
VVLDARTRAEFMDFSIPGAHSVPGCELAWRAAAYAPDPSTAIVVNCAGRTRSIIGAQTLVQAGLPNPVAALRNGTIAWILGGGRLEVGPSPEKIGRARLRDGLPESQAAVRGRMRDWAARLPVKVVDEPALRRLRRSRGRTVYLFDVRTAQEYEGGHPPGFRHAPGGQLVQAADRFMGVMGAAVVLADFDGVRAWTTAAWLAQMGAWEVLVHPVPRAAALEAGPERRTILRDPLSGPAAMVTPHGARRLMAQGAPVADVDSSLDFIRGHVPGAKFVAPPRLGWFGASFAPGGRNAQYAPDGPDGPDGPDAPPIVLTSGDGLLAASLAGRLNGGPAGRRFVAVTGGTRAWAAEGLPLETGGEGILTGEEDVRRSACEYGQGLVREALGEDRGDYDQRFVDYLAWEVDLVNQLGRPGVKADFRLAAP